MPEFCSEIDPFLVSVRIPGGTFEQSVEARKRPIQQRNQIVFEIDLQSYVLVVLAAACFKCLPNLISRRAFLVLTPKLQWKGNWPDETFNGLTMSGC